MKVKMSENEKFDLKIVIDIKNKKLLISNQNWIKQCTISSGEKGDDMAQ